MTWLLWLLVELCDRDVVSLFANPDLSVGVGGPSGWFFGAGEPSGWFFGAWLFWVDGLAAGFGGCGLVETVGRLVTVWDEERPPNDDSVVSLSSVLARLDCAITHI